MNELHRRILFPIDDSETCDIGFQWYIKNYHRKGDELILVCILTPSFTRGTNALDGDGASNGLASDMVSAFRLGAAEVRQIANRYARICRKNGIDYRTVAAYGSEIGKTIVRAITQNMVDSVVIGYHAMGRLKRAFLGSASRYVLRNSPVPVVVIPSTNSTTVPSLENFHPF